jgi:hypothetical protein
MGKYARGGAIGMFAGLVCSSILVVAMGNGWVGVQT